MFQRLIMLALALPAVAAAQTLRIEDSAQVRELTTAQLLERPDVRDILVHNDVSYHRDMHYLAVPLRSLLPGLTDDEHVQFIAADGFSGEVPARLMLDAGRTTGWLAVEPASHPWQPGN